MIKINKFKIFVGVVVAANLLLFAHSIWWNFATVDEVRQIPAGLSHWRLGSFKLANETPPAARLIADLPVLAAAHSEWFLGYIDRPIYLNSTIKDQISAFFAYENAKRFVVLVRLARLAGFAWWLLGAWVIFRWSRTLYSGRAGYLGLLLWSFEPNVLACEPLASADLPAAVAGLAANYVFWRYLCRSSWEGALIAGLVLGVAQLTDFAALLLYCLWPVLAAIHWLGHRSDGSHAQRFGHRVGQAVLIWFLSIWVINMGYAATDSGLQLKNFAFVSRSFGGSDLSPDPFHGNLPVGNRFREGWLGGLPVPLPADYLLGIDLTIRAAEMGCSPLSSGDGETVRAASFSSAALTTTIPLGLLMMVLWSAMLTVWRRSGGSSWRDEVFWGLPVAAIVILSASQAGFHFLHGHVLLVIPYGIIAASKLAGYLKTGHRKCGVLVAALVIWFVSSSLIFFVRCLSYVNELAGHRGPVANQLCHGGGGQDLLRLRDWQERHPDARPLGVAVHHLIDPRDCGIECSLPPVDTDSPYRYIPFTPPKVGPRPGYYALDLHSLASGNYSYFRYFIPIARIGYSILVYDITLDEADRVRGQLALPIEAEAEKQDHLLERRHSWGDRAFRLRVYESPNGRRINYALFVPKDYRVDAPHPLILFLHGFGDAGTEGRQYLKVGLPRIIEQGFDPGFIVVCPQGRTGIWAPESEDGRHAMAILAAVERELNVDSKRIVLTGLSSGGTGTWELATRHPDRWAAIVPVSSVCDVSQAARVRHIPCWVFHNCNDEGGYYHKYDSPGSPVAGPRRMIRAIVAAGGSPRYTELLHIGDTHDAWDKAYTMSDLFDWLAKQRRP